MGCGSRLDVCVYLSEFTVFGIVDAEFHVACIDEIRQLSCLVFWVRLHHLSAYVMTPLLECFL